MFRFLISAVIFVASTQQSFAETGFVTAHDTNMLPYTLRIERIGETSSFQILDCGEKFAGSKVDPSKCNIVMADVQGVQKTNLPEQVTKQLKDFNNSKETKNRLVMQGLGGGAVLLAMIACGGTALGCLWYPVLEWQAGARLVPIAIAIADLVAIYGAYKWYQGITELGQVVKDFEQLAIAISDLSKTSKAVTEITVSQIFRNTFVGMANSQLMAR